MPPPAINIDRLEKLRLKQIKTGKWLGFSTGWNLPRIETNQIVDRELKEKIERVEKAFECKSIKLTEKLSAPDASLVGRDFSPL